MPRKKRQQKSISVETEEWDLLNRLKREYGQKAGEDVDWGSFLGTVALLGLAAAGVYRLVESLNRTGRAVSASCPVCGQVFPVAIPFNSPRVIQFPCPNPHCQTPLVLDLGRATQ